MANPNNSSIVEDITNIKTIYQMAESNLSDRDLYLRKLALTPDPLLNEKMEFIHAVLISTENNAEKRELINIFYSIKIRVVIPLVHLLKMNAAASPELRMNINSTLIKMGDVSIEPIIQLFSLDDRIYFESVLPVLKSLRKSSLIKLREAQQSDNQKIRYYSSIAEKEILISKEAPKTLFKAEGFPEPPTYESFAFGNYDGLYDSMNSWG